MPILQHAIAWAVPVKPDILGGHLQAHVDTLPVIETLRLCHSFGRGPKASVVKLPIELRSEIEKYVIQEARGKTLPEWNQKFRCYQDSCSASQHEDPEEYHDEHEDRAQEWYRRLAWYDGYFAEHATLIRKHFGLIIWVSETQLKQQEDDDSESKKPTTTAYLTLPGYRTISKSYLLHAELKDQWQWELESGYGLPLELGATPTMASLARFARAMRILDLVPFEGSGTAKKPLIASLTDKDEDIAASDDDQGAEDEDDATESKQKDRQAKSIASVRAVKPRLTLLVVSEVGGGEGAYLLSL
ncbi:hypothetical protein LTR85_010940 [Meristemomyces frigidus]|nr:hypothetical protein LTR85_010940 [Meristemomyces frigidus]